jgi:tetratricopeptide (TPR) repeat protein
MKKEKLKQTLCAIAGGLIVFGGFFFVFHLSKDAEYRKLAENIVGFGPRRGVPRTIDDLKRAIAAYENLQIKHVKDAAQTGAYWKILASRFQQKEMFFEAIKALEQAIRYAPNDEVLHYLTGLNAALAAKSVYDYEKGSGGNGMNTEQYLNLAEAAYLRALEIEPLYTQARYAIAVLYVFELNRPADAVTHLVQYMENRSGDAEAMFLLARAYYASGQYHKAVDWYDRAIPLIKDEERRHDAQQNRDLIMNQIK